MNGHISDETFARLPFCPISASGSKFNPQNIPYIPAVKFFAFLELEENWMPCKGLLSSLGIYHKIIQFTCIFENFRFVLIFQIIRSKFDNVHPYQNVRLYNPHQNFHHRYCLSGRHRYRVDCRIRIVSVILYTVSVFIHINYRLFG